MLPIPALVLYAPSVPHGEHLAHRLRDELTWRGFDPVVEGLHGDIDASNARLLVLVFPAIPIPLFAGRPLGSIRGAVDRIRGLEGCAVALLAVSPLPTARLTDHVARAVERQGGQVVVSDSVPPFGPTGAIVDLAAECMVRVPG